MYILLCIFFHFKAQREWEIDEDLENFVTQKEYLPLDKLDHNQNQTHLLENENQKTVEPYKVEIVDKDYFAQKKKEIKDNFLYDTPGILNETQVNLFLLFNNIIEIFT